MTLEQPSALDLRAELEDLALRDLLGPAGGPEEIVDDRSVRGRYILGLLAPRGQSALPEEDGTVPKTSAQPAADDTAEDGELPDEDELAKAGADTQDGKPASPAAPVTAMLPSSIGFTFSVTAQAPGLAITARWGQYRRVRTEIVRDDKGEPKLVWQRQPVEATSVFVLKPGKLGPWYPDPENELVYVEGRLRQRPEVWTITLYLINAQREPKKSKDEAWLFQAELAVGAPQAAMPEAAGDPAERAIFVKRPLPPGFNPVTDPDDRSMAMLYRRELEFAVGHGVGVRVTPAPGDGAWDRAVGIQTCTVPGFEVERMDAPSPADIPALAATVTDMQTLAEMADGDFAAALGPLADSYEAWIAAQAQRLADPAPDLLPFQPDGEVALQACRATLARMRAGLALLGSNPQAAEAFRFANRAMWQQRVRSLFARAARQAPAQPPDLAEFDVPANRRWYPFQLAFVLLNLPGLVDPTHPDRSHPTAALVDLLWFPTGGGKTEAYLGVAAFTMAYRRLTDTVADGAHRGAGVAVLMRYTLRLLTLQQFQRAAALICACELIRRADPARWGAEPFRIGLWVGMRSTPNYTEDAAQIVTQLRQGGMPGAQGTLAQLTNCPWCGQPIRPGTDIYVETFAGGRGRTFQFCSDPLGRCPFSRKQSPDEGLPIVVVDEEIYRRLPALLIATVDKFAQMPWKGETQMLFGKVNGYCPRHGYRSPDLEDKSSHPARGSLPACKTQALGPLRPPDLIIQDELHLISGPLGTLVGLYETAIDRLCQWTLAAPAVAAPSDASTHTPTPPHTHTQLVRPKVIASTATIRRSGSQVKSLYLREVAVFPPAGLDVTDNFFSRRRPSDAQAPARRYIGICAPGQRLRTVLIRVYVAFMGAAQTLYVKYGAAADPWLTLVGYFNALRELGGMRRAVDDTVRTRLRRIDERGLSKRFIDQWSVEELTSRKNATDIPRILDRLEASFEPQPEGKRKTGPLGTRRGEASRQPYDVVLATNMISVGVDVGRLGLMVVASQPKATAEYIQATSRVGRSFPGLVVTVYNWARPRDLSHYERFEHYHATFYQQVEALSVTPFSPRALDRGLTALLVSYIRLLDDRYNANDRAGQLDRQAASVAIAIDDISRRAGLVVHSVQAETLVRQLLAKRLDEWLAQAQAVTGGAVLGYKRSNDGLTLGLLKYPDDEDWTRFTCLNSLRDVEPNVTLIMDNFGMDREPNPAIAATPETGPAPESGPEGQGA